MSVSQQQPDVAYVSSSTRILLRELGAECRYVLQLLNRLETPDLDEAQQEQILGEMSAAVLHLHEHTRDLDVVIDEDSADRR